MASEKNYIFIIGSPRSGTTWLHIMMGSHPLVCTTVELALFDEYISPLIDAWKRNTKITNDGQFIYGLPSLWSEGEFYDFLRNFIDKVYERVRDSNPNGKYILDKHPGYVRHVETINAFFPQSLFIHVIRDGRDVVASMVAASQEMGFMVRNISVQEAAKQWKQYVIAGRKARQYSGRYIEVKYEELLNSGVEALGVVLDFCGLSVSDNELTAIIDKAQFKEMKHNRPSADRRIKLPEAFYRKGKQGSWREDIKPVQRYIFEKEAGDLLYELGYAEKHWWAETTSQRFILPVIALYTGHAKHGRTLFLYAARHLKQQLNKSVGHRMR